ncbi:cadherin-related protein [Elysia marginata]|uniref:Cadherin-related protein n=1 Tax=Elysia marginata TaxID=1093978 RepID=A0AAV4FEV9_9GAST|nr:cadherin-related protein [Elysia marginata]
MLTQEASRDTFHTPSQRCVRNAPHDDVGSVTSGETATSDSGRGGSEDDIPLPPIAECSPELNSNHSSPKHVVEYRPITTSPPNSLGRQPYGGKSEFRTMPTLSSFRGGSEAIKLYPVSSSTTRSHPSDTTHQTVLGHSPYNSLPSSYGDKVHPSGKPGHDYKSLGHYPSGGGSPVSKPIGSQGRHVTFSPTQPALRGSSAAQPQHSPPSLFPDPSQRSAYSPLGLSETAGFYTGGTSRPRSIDDEDGNTTTSGSYTIDSDNLNDSIISA